MKDIMVSYPNCLKFSPITFKKYSWTMSEDWLSAQYRKESVSFHGSLEENLPVKLLAYPYCSPIFLWALCFSESCMPKNMFIYSWALAISFESTPWLTTRKNPCFLHASFISWVAFETAKGSPVRKLPKSIGGIASFGDSRHGFSWSGQMNWEGILAWCWRIEASNTNGCRGGVRVGGITMFVAKQSTAYMCVYISISTYFRKIYIIGTRRTYLLFSWWEKLRGDRESLREDRGGK